MRKGIKFAFEENGYRVKLLFYGTFALQKLASLRQAFRECVFSLSLVEPGILSSKSVQRKNHPLVRAQFWIALTNGWFLYVPIVRDSCAEVALSPTRLNRSLMAQRRCPVFHCDQAAGFAEMNRVSPFPVKIHFSYSRQSGALSVHTSGTEWAVYPPTGEPPCRGVRGRG